MIDTVTLTLICWTTNVTTEKILDQPNVPTVPKNTNISFYI